MVLKAYILVHAPFHIKWWLMLATFMPGGITNV